MQLEKKYSVSTQQLFPNLFCPPWLTPPIVLVIHSPTRGRHVPAYQPHIHGLRAQIV